MQLILIWQRLGLLLDILVAVPLTTWACLPATTSPAFERALQLLTLMAIGTAWACPLPRNICTRRARVLIPTMIELLAWHDIEAPLVLHMLPLVPILCRPTPMATLTPLG